MESTLREMIPGRRMKFSASNGSGDFPDSYIVVDFGGPEHADVWATNNVHFNEGEPPHAFININPELLKEPSEKRKLVYAHEFIEVILTLKNKKRPEKRVIKDKVMLNVMFNKLKQRCLWQDSKEFESSLGNALRLILVSEESIREFARETLYMEVSEIRKKISEDPDEMGNNINNLATGFAAKYSVELDLVYDRIRETLFNDYM